MESSEIEEDSMIERAAPPQSIWVNFLTDVAEIVLEFLGEIDTCGYLNMICKNWNIIPNERTYKILCEHVYTSQTAKKKLNVMHFGGSWRKMLTTRPRLRTNGVYWLRTSLWKKPHNDMFWEEKICEFLEVCNEQNIISILFVFKSFMFSVYLF